MNKKSCYLDKNDFSHICKYQRVHWATEYIQRHEIIALFYHVHNAKNWVI